MKIVQVNKYNFIKGGADKYFIDLSDLLSRQADWQVAKFCMDHPQNLPDRFSKYFVSHLDFDHFHWSDILKYLSRVFYSREAKRQFQALLEEFQPDLIHIHNIYHQISPSILDVAKAKGIPVLMHVHDYKLVCPNYKMFSHGRIDESTKGGRYYRCLFNRCFKGSLAKSLLVTLEMYWHHRILKIYEKNIDLYIAPSQFVKNKLIEWGIEADKIKLLYHYVISEGIKPDYRLGDYLLYFGRLDQEKGVDVLIRAMAILKSQVKLKIVGFGPQYKTLKNLTAELGLVDRVEFLGPKFGPELRDIIAGSYLVVVPSVWYEVFGLVILESAVLGKFVVASDIGGIKETVQSSRTAILFQPGNYQDLATKLDWSLANPSAIEGFAHEARNFVTNKFTVEAHLKGLLDLYRSVLK